MASNQRHMWLVPWPEIIRMFCYSNLPASETVLPPPETAWRPTAAESSWKPRCVLGMRLAAFSKLWLCTAQVSTLQRSAWAEQAEHCSTEAPCKREPARAAALQPQPFLTHPGRAVNSGVKKGGRNCAENMPFLTLFNDYFGDVKSCEVVGFFF